MHLVDSNVWMQVLRDREHAAECRQFLKSADRLYVTDFAIHSIGLTLQRYGQGARFKTFLAESAVGAGIPILRLEPSELALISGVCDAHRLDFDDAYQYVAAEMLDLSIVSFDADFDHTPRGRRTPAQILATLTDEK